ncbi:hypothetical protein ACXR0O_25425 [Verrucomicrobiota bacterium sgz303538]
MLNHSPISLVFFVIGAVLGYTAAAVLLLSLSALIIRHRRRSLVASISTLSWVIVASGILCGVAYGSELLFAWSRGNPFEQAALSRSISGPGAWLFWIQAFGSVLAPQLFWFRRARRTAWLSLAICLAIVAPANVERLILHLSTQADFTPDSWKQ